MTISQGSETELADFMAECLRKVPCGGVRYEKGGVEDRCGPGNKKKWPGHVPECVRVSRGEISHEIFCALLHNKHISSY